MPWAAGDVIRDLDAAFAIQSYKMISPGTCCKTSTIVAFSFLGALSKSTKVTCYLDDVEGRSC